MRINKFLFKFRILIVLFSFVFNLFMPVAAICSRKGLKTGGQLSLSVIQKDDDRKGEIVSKHKRSSRRNFRNLNSLEDDNSLSENFDSNLNKNVESVSVNNNFSENELFTAANLEVSVDGQNAAEVKPEVSLTPVVATSEKTNIEQEKKQEQVAQEPAQKVLEQGQQAVQEQAQKKSFIIQKEMAQKKVAAEKQKGRQEQRRLIKKYPGQTGTSEDDQETVVFNFEDVDLANVAAYVENLFDIKFITDDIINPMNPNSTKPLSGNKVSFKTQKPMTKKQAWDLFVEFLGMAGLSLIPQSDPKFFRVTIISEVKKNAIPVYINHDPEKLPDSGMIRYGYFVKDCPLDTINSVLSALKSSSADLLILNDHNAFILTDSAYNIKILMKIVKELDNVTMPQTMSVMRLYKAEAKYAAEVYSKLTQESENAAVSARLFGPKSVSKSMYFPKKAKVFVDERTNSLILLGSSEAIKTIEDFVREHIDIDVETPYSPLYVYQLKYANAKDVSGILTELVAFGDKNKPGALRGGDKYFKNMNFTAEEEGNRIIIRGDYDDYLKVKEIIDQIDEQPKQVNMEIMILSVEVQDQKMLGSQLRNQFRSPDGSPINFQTSGINLGGGAQKIQMNTTETCKGAYRLLGDLVNLVTASAAGATAFTLGTDKFGVWGVFGVLDTITNTQIISNPFLTVTNNTTARVKLGESARIVTAEITNTGNVQALGDTEALIDVTVTPKINSDGMIVVDIDVMFNSFVGTNYYNQIKRQVKTSAVMANHEILALGGLLKDKVDDKMSRVPILGDIPGLGWLFKNKNKNKTKDDLLILINANVIDPNEPVKECTKRHLKEYRDNMQQFEAVRMSKDPIDRAMFKDKPADFSLNDFIFTRGHEDVIGKKDLLDIANENSRVAILNEGLKGYKKKSTLKFDKKEKRPLKEKKERKNVKKASRDVKTQAVA